MPTPLQRLCEIVPPPRSPNYVPSSADWSRVCSEIGVEFPDDIRQFCAVYGLGTFRGTEATGFSVSSPGHPEFLQNLRDELNRLREIQGGKPNEYHPYNVYPESDGLLPWGADECDIWLCWNATGSPDSWPITLRWTFGRDGIHTFDKGLVEFLVGLFERRIELPCWPEPFFVDDVRFEPYNG